MNKILVDKMPKNCEECPCTGIINCRLLDKDNVVIGYDKNKRK